MPDVFQWISGSRVASRHRIMTIEQAAQALQAELAHFPWLVAITTGAVEGRPTLYVYAKTMKNVRLTELRHDGYAGFPVKVEKTSPTRPGLR